MGHAGHGFHNNLHYRPRKPYGPIVSTIRGVLALAAFLVNPFLWLFAYWAWQNHREKKKALQKEQAVDRPV